MEKLTEDHLLYFLASYLSIPSMVSFSMTSKRMYSLMHMNDELWEGGKEGEKLPWYALKLKVRDILNGKTTPICIPELETVSASSSGATVSFPSKTPYRDFCIKISNSERLFLSTSLSYFKCFPDLDKTKCALEHIWSWCESISDMIVGADDTDLRLFHKILSIWNIMGRMPNYLDELREVQPNVRAYIERLIQIIEQMGLGEAFKTFLGQRKLFAFAVVRLLSLAAHEKSMRCWKLLLSTTDDAHSTTPLSIIKGMLILSTIYVDSCSQAEGANIVVDADDFMPHISCMVLAVWEELGIGGDGSHLDKIEKIRAMNRAQVCKALNEVMFVKFGYRGVSPSEYYRMDNSFLHIVMQKRAGLISSCIFAHI